MKRGWIGFFGKQFESNGEKRRIWRTTRNLSPSAYYRETNHCSLWRLRQMHCIWRIFYWLLLHRHSLLSRKTWRHYALLKKTTLLSQPENEKVYSLGDYVAVHSETDDWFMCVVSEINDPSKEVKVRLIRKSGHYFLLSKKLEKWFPKPAIFHRCSIPSIDNRMRYPFDAINTKGICDKIKHTCTR